MHDAATIWVSNVTAEGFRIYVRALDTEQPYANWIAYQINVHRRMDAAFHGGSIKLPTFKGSTCTDVIDYKVLKYVMLSFFGPTPTGRIRTYKLSLISVSLSVSLSPPVFLRNRALEFSNILF